MDKVFIWYLKFLIFFFLNWLNFKTIIMSQVIVFFTFLSTLNENTYNCQIFQLHLFWNIWNGKNPRFLYKYVFSIHSKKFIETKQISYVNSQGKSDFFFHPYITTHFLTPSSFGQARGEFQLRSLGMFKMLFNRHCLNSVVFIQLISKNLWKCTAKIILDGVILIYWWFFKIV